MSWATRWSQQNPPEKAKGEAGKIEKGSAKENVEPLLLDMAAHQLPVSKMVLPMLPRLGSSVDECRFDVTTVFCKITLSLGASSAA
jgi:hypothetical protein